MENTQEKHKHYQSGSGNFVGNHPWARDELSPFHIRKDLHGTAIPGSNFNLTLYNISFYSLSACGSKSCSPHSNTWEKLPAFPK